MKPWFIPALRAEAPNEVERDRSDLFGELRLIC